MPQDVSSPLSAGTREETLGDLKCMLVYSDQAHVNYIFKVLNPVEEVLRRRNFAPVRLSEDIRSSNVYREQLSRLVRDSSLVVVILDGLRPNVTFEMGFALGEAKPTIVLKDKNARVSVRSLYRSREAEYGLDDKHRELEDPALLVPIDFSDYAGIHVAEFDWEADAGLTLHPAEVLTKELDKAMEEILAEGRRQKTTGLGGGQELLGEILDPVTVLLKRGYGTGDEAQLSVADARTRIESAVANHKVEMPLELAGLVANAYMADLKVDSVRHGVSLLTAAFERQDGVIKSARDAANVRTLGYGRLELAGLGVDPVQNDRAALGIFEQLEAYCHSTDLAYQRSVARSDTALAQRNLGMVTAEISLIEQACEGYAQARTFFTRDSAPLQYAILCCGKGNAHLHSAYIKDRIASCKAALAELTEGLSCLSMQEAPDLYFTARMDIAEVHSALADAKERSSNCHDAIKMCADLERTLGQKGMGERLARIHELKAVTYGRLSEAEDHVANAHESVDYARSAIRHHTDQYRKSLVQANLFYGLAMQAWHEGPDKPLVEMRRDFPLARRALEDVGHSVGAVVLDFNMGLAILASVRRQRDGVRTLREEALRLLRSSLKMFEEHGMELHAAEAHFRIGLAAAVPGDGQSLDAARASFAKAREAAELMGVVELVSWVDRELTGLSSEGH